MLTSLFFKFTGKERRKRKNFALVQCSILLKHLLLLLSLITFQVLVDQGLKGHVRSVNSLTHFSPMSHFYTSWKRQKTYFQGVWKCDIGLKWVKCHNTPTPHNHFLYLFSFSTVASGIIFTTNFSSTTVRNSKN